MALKRKREDSQDELDDLPAPTTTYMTGSFVAGYRFLESLGRGAFGVVYRAVDLRNNRYVAIKVISVKKRREFFDLATHEIHVGAYLAGLANSRPNPQFVVELYGDFQIYGNWFLIYELLLINLEKLLRTQFRRGLYTEHLKTIIRCIISGLNFMHEVGVIHCDLKPDNIVLKDWISMECKIVDFGLCEFKKTENRWDIPLQTPSYRAPEVYLQKLFDDKVDIFSAGCIFAECACGRRLINEINDAERMALMVNLLGMPPCWMVRGSLMATKYFSSTCPLRFRQIPGHQPIFSFSLSIQDRVPLQHDNDIRFYNLLFKCLDMDPTRRSSARELLEHPWLGSQKKMSRCTIS